MAISTTPPDKRELRARFDAYRRRLSVEAHAALSAAIVARLEALPAYRSARCVHAFWPMVERGEVDLRPLLLAGHRAGKQILLPVVIPHQGAAMTHRLFEGEERLQPRALGVHEPMGAETVPDEAIDLVLTPALGADLSGYRLGYGKGFYDAFLGRLAARAVCTVFDACIVETLPREPHDIPVSYLVTESRLLRVPPP